MHMVKKPAKGYYIQHQPQNRQRNLGSDSEIVVECIPSLHPLENHHRNGVNTPKTPQVFFCNGTCFRGTSKVKTSVSTSTCGTKGGTRYINRSQLFDNFASNFKHQMYCKASNKLNNSNKFVCKLSHEPVAVHSWQRGRPIYLLKG